MASPTTDTPEADDSRLTSFVNFRDLGGLRTVAGALTRPGVLYRADAPYAGDDPPEVASSWPPTNVLDLRSETEPRNPFGWPGGANVEVLPLLGAAAPNLRTQSLTALYLGILELEGARLVRILHVAAHSRGPLLIHCALGKDRTGLTVAALLLAAGVEQGAVVADYVASAPNVDLVMDRMRAAGYPVPPDDQLPRHLMGATATDIELAIEVLMGATGGADGWFAAHGAPMADLERWRERLTGQPQ
ncbi:MAG: iphP3 [Conexibacter sp.]|nr:iphP3 [Conexibacter sp.]